MTVLPGLRNSPIKYIVYITKENRTYDEVFGQLKNADGDSALARFGVNNEYTSSVTKTAKIFSKAPGRRHPGTAGSMDPEDYWDADAPYTYARKDSPYGEENSLGPETGPVLHKNLREMLSELNQPE